MKSLTIIQTIAKIGRILSKIIEICCIVSFCICIVNLITCAALNGETFKLGGVTILSMLESRAQMNLPTVVACFAVGAAFSAAYAVLGKKAESYFKNELADGTPFTLRGANELMRLGILTAAVSVGTAILCAIGVAAASHFVPEIQEISFEEYSAVGVGLAMIVLSLFCRCGAEQLEEKAAIPEPPAQQENEI